MSAIRAFAVAGLLLVTCMQAHGQEPQPLPNREVVKVGFPALLKATSILILAKELGEFEKENIVVEYVIQRPSDGLVLLSTGRIDVLASQPSAAFFNAVAGGSEVKLTIPAGFLAPEGKQGVWVSKAFLNGRKYSPDLLNGQTIASAAGPGTIISHYVEHELEKAGLDQNAIKWKTMGIADILVALENGAVNFGVLLDPISDRADESKIEFAFCCTQDVAGAYFFGPTLLRDRRAVGEAFVRAMVRATRAALTGDFRKNPRTVEILAKQLGVTEASIREGSRMVFPAELPIPANLGALLQKTYFITPGLLGYPAALPEDRVVDRSFLLAAGAGQ